MNTLENDKICTLFGEFIRYEREKKGLFQREVAEQLGMTQTYYSYLENGKREITLTLALNICQVLGLEFNDFLYSLSRKKARVILPENEENSTPV